MPSSSHLRLQTAFEPISAETTRSRYISSPPQAKQKMSLTQTYFIAASARSKLGKEASRADHDLRLLVGHANLLDTLMLELHDAERQQEAWFNQTMAKASRSQEARHIHWTEGIVEDSDSDESDSDSDMNEDDLDAAPMHRNTVSSIHISTTEIDDDDDDDEFYDDMEDDTDLALTRVSSQAQAQSPPELVYEEDSDDDSPLASPPSASLDFSEKEALLTTTFYTKSLPQYDDSLFMDTSAPLISSY